MTKRVKAAGLLLAIAACSAIPEQASAASATRGTEAWAAVDPFIGTGGEGHTFPGAVVPFGMVQLSPDTQIKPRKEGYGWAAGYRYDDTTIVGFSHTHFSGAGHSDLGDVLVMPIAGEVKLEPGDIDKPGSGYRSRFSHDDEGRSPATTPSRSHDYGIRAELTAGARVGVHRYTFPDGQARACAASICARASTTTRARCCGRGLRLRADGTRHRLPRNARLGAGPPALFRDALLAAASADMQFHDTEEDVAVQGLPAAGRGRSAPARADRRARSWSARSTSARCARTALMVKVAISPVERRQRDRQPRRRDAGLGFRRACAPTRRRNGRRRSGAVEIERRRRCARASTPRSTTPAGARACSWTATAAIAGPTTRSTRPRASPTTRRSRCGTPTARCIRC